MKSFTALSSVVIAVALVAGLAQAVPEGVRNAVEKKIKSDIADLGKYQWYASDRDVLATFIFKVIENKYRELVGEAALSNLNQSEEIYLRHVLKAYQKLEESIVLQLETLDKRDSSGNAQANAGIFMQTLMDREQQLQKEVLKYEAQNNPGI